MNVSDIIAKKRDGQQLTTAEIEWFITSYTSGAVPDYQMSALSMAICINGMQPTEIHALTLAMLESGITLRWPQAGRPLVDKHSTGGIGDKVSLVLAPLLACCGLRVPMISGRGLGVTGGTLDKLESIQGFRTDLTLSELQNITEQVGCVITGTTEDIAPADRRWYTLRDVTATVPSLALITGSIMCKKLAEGLDALVLDVKCGSGTSMKTHPQARALAESLVQVGRSMGVATTALVTDMDQPLGQMIGNAVEVNEAVVALEGGGPAELRELTLALGAEALAASQQETDRSAATARLAQLLDGGQAREKFAQMVSAQGGRLDVLREVAPSQSICAETDGHVAGVDAGRLGQAVVDLGGGRKILGDSIDYGVGLKLCVRIGDLVQRGQELMQVFCRTTAADPLLASLAAAVQISESPCTSRPLVLDQLGGEVGAKADE
jgi:pyrimidine-nucleoside phosphorylase